MMTGCVVEYHGHDSAIDGVLWRQIATFEDPLSEDLYRPEANDPQTYLESLNGMRWDGRSSSAAQLDLSEGGIVLYERAERASSAQVSVFIASGPRPAVPTDEGHRYAGPGEVYTCYRLETRFASEQPRVERTILDECPRALVELVAEDAAFASGEVFDG